MVRTFKTRLTKSYVNTDSSVVPDMVIDMFLKRTSLSALDNVLFNL